MTNTLKVIKPFNVVEVDEMFTLNESGWYERSYKEEKHESDDPSCNAYSFYESVYRISPIFAEMLIEDGYLKEVEEDSNKPFVNVFDEINDMLEVYQSELDNLDKEMADQPKALKVEKETVLENMIKVLTHLKSLRK